MQRRRDWAAKAILNIEEENARRFSAKEGGGITPESIASALAVGAKAIKELKDQASIRPRVYFRAGWRSMLI